MKDIINTYDKASLIDDIKIVPFDVSKRYTKPHRHNKYLEIIYFTKGEGFHHVDSISYQIKPYIFFVVNREEVHNWEINTLPKGYVIIIKERFLDKTLDKYINIQLNKLRTLQKIELPNKDASINALFKVLCKEMEQPKPQAEFVEGVLKALLVKMMNYSYENTSNDNAGKITGFMELLIEKPRNNVAFYANALSLSSQNLNQLCRKQFNRTASQIIAIEVLKEVKRLILFTDNSISEIAFKLDFKDVSHFVKYFKRHTGYTPLQFKKRH
ncbi:helix-turn-helix domain-containing protein [Mariniflexile sp.]|uniref:helix-turn-helix domain-containing protein n=1 Tax=Mariniflexile sp. TaxID=1979402 RepID=UPI00404816F2